MEYPNCFVAEIKDLNYPNMPSVCVFERKPDFMDKDMFWSEINNEISLYKETIFKKELGKERFVVTEVKQLDEALFNRICNGPSGIEVIDAMRVFCAQIDDYKQKVKKEKRSATKKGFFSKLFASM